MGLEATCSARYAGRSSEGRARLESAELHFRGDFRIDLPFSKMQAIRARDGVLRIETENGTVALELGAAAEQWADKILNPKPVIDKLGVKPGHVVSILGALDGGFMRQVRTRAAEVATGRPRRNSDLIFLEAKTQATLGRLAALKRSIRPNGAVWVVWRKGQPQLKEDHVRGAALKVGLTDVKVVAFSPTHSALKLVIPLAQR